jgi:hypothetical protein
MIFVNAFFIVTMESYYRYAFQKYTNTKYKILQVSVPSFVFEQQPIAVYIPFVF